MASEDKKVTKSLYSITCELCGAEVKTKGMSSHLKIHNMTNKEYYDKYMKKDKEDICPTCGGKNKFTSITAGYKKHCSTKCSSLDPEIHAKLKATNKERYGFEYSAQRQVVKDKMAKTNRGRYGGVAPSCSKEIREKTKKTWLEKYGVDHPMKCVLIKEELEKHFWDTLGAKSPLESDKVLEKIKTTINNKYGVDNPFQIEGIREKIKSTFLKKYGCEHPMQNKDVKSKVFDSYIENDKYMAEKGYFKVQDLIEIYGYGFRSSEKIKEKFFKYKDTNYLHKSYLSLIEEYVEDVQSGSMFEKEVLDFVSSIYNGKIIKNSRNVIPPKELDIYLPDKNIAIECNGIYYHSENFGIPKDYHKQKTNMCNEKNIRLIHINESDWEYHKEVCKSIISTSLNIYQDKINVKDCILKGIKEREFYDFLNNNCLDKDEEMDFAIGVYYKKELVQAFSFKQLNDEECKLVKKCTKLGLKVKDDLIAVVNYIFKDKANKIITFLDISKYDLKEYCNEGWQLVSFVKPSYTLYKNSGKIKVVNEEIVSSMDLANNRFLKVYDCGRAVLEISKHWKVDIEEENEEEDRNIQGNKEGKEN